MGTVKKVIESADAPAAIGTYSQAIQVDNTVYVSGQIPLDPLTQELVSDELVEQAHQVFKNLEAVCKQTGGNLGDVVKLNIYLTDLSCFQDINQVMSQYFQPPYPARVAIGVAELPKNSLVEADAVMQLVT